MVFYNLLKGISPASLFFAWFAILFQFLPIYYSWLLGGCILLLIIAMLTRMKVRN